MPRPEKPIQADGPVAAFAAQLRTLRRDAGNLPYRSMALLANYSSTTLSQAAAGKRLPPWDVVKAYVKVCGGNEQEWKTYWTKTRDTAATLPATRPGQDIVAVPLIQPVEDDVVLPLVGEGEPGRVSVAADAGRDGDSVSVAAPRWPELERWARPIVQDDHVVHVIAPVTGEPPIPLVVEAPPVFTAAPARPMRLRSPGTLGKARPKNAKPDPNQAVTMADLAELLNQYRQYAGLTWRALAELSRVDRWQGRWLAASTIHDALVSRQAPNLQMTAQIVEICGASPQEVRIWRQAWRNVREHEQRAQAALAALRGDITREPAMIVVPGPDEPTQPVRRRHVLITTITLVIGIFAAVVVVPAFLDARTTPAVFGTGGVLPAAAGIIGAVLLYLPLRRNSTMRFVARALYGRGEHRQRSIREEDRMDRS